MNKPKALFLDRDGVINEDSGYVYKPEDFHFIDGIFELCHTALKQGYLLIIITNQAGIARGYYTEEDYLALNRWMLEEFNKRDIHITATYYCPYHLEHGIGIYKKDSFDRKPNPGMILEAKEEFDIDLKNSILIGDKDSDIESGRRAGMGKLILLKGNYPIEPTPDVLIYDSLTDINLSFSSL